MRFLFKQFHHLIRYFLIIGLLVFFGYIKHWGVHWHFDFFLVLIGPALYTADQLKNLITTYVRSLPNQKDWNYYAFLLPTTVLYFCLVGFQLKKLWNERGKIRILSILALIFFLVYIHNLAWKNLTNYFKSAPKPIAKSAD